MCYNALDIRVIVAICKGNPALSGADAFTKEQIMGNQKGNIDIDLLDLFYYLKKKVWYIIAALVLFAVIGACYTNFFVEDKYTAKTRMYVLSRSSDTELSSSDYSIANYMIKDYEVLIIGENVTREVIDKLGLNMSVGQLAAKISVSAIDNTRVLQIAVVDTHPQRAADIANCVREVSSAQIKSIMDVDAVNLVYNAEVPTHKSSPSLSKNTLTAAIVGAALAVIILIVVYLLDDAIRTDEDVTRYLGLSTLGTIPASKELESSGNFNAALKRKRMRPIALVSRKK